MFSRNRKIIGIFLVRAIISPAGAIAGAGAAQSPGADAISANQKGLGHFRHGFYDLVPHGRKAEAHDEFTRAERAFLKAIELNGDFVEAHRNLARLYYVQKKFEKAEAEYSQVMRLDPGDLDNYVQMALVATELGNFQEAIRYLEAAKQKTGNAEIIRKLDGYIQKVLSAARDSEDGKGGGK
jgi:tetratricopeptide (TPR) repeat protein